MSQYDLLMPDDYVRELLASIAGAQRRINMIALVIREDTATERIIDALCAAARRGVSVDVGMDFYFTYKEVVKGSKRWRDFRAQVQSMRATRSRLHDAGAQVRWLGQFGATLFSRRTHVKWSVIDDRVFSFGGINLYHGGLQFHDFMLSAEDARLAERMSAEHDFVISTDRAGRAYPSHSFGVSDGAVLIDGGKMFDSLIFRRACNLADQAERIVFVSQYCPTSRLARILKAKKAEVYYNRWQGVKDVLDRSLVRVSSFINRVPTQYRRSTYLHAKFMIFEMIDGDKVALTGSHNFVASGGWLGTREVALETRDPEIIALLETFLDGYVREAAS